MPPAQLEQPVQPVQAPPSVQSSQTPLPPVRHRYTGFHRWATGLVRKNKGVLRFVRACRFMLIIGPFRGLAIRALQKFSPNPTMERIEPSLFPTLDVAATVGTLKEKGLAGGFSLPQSSVDAIKAYLGSKKEIENPHWDCPEIQRIVHDRAMVDIAAKYLGSEPLLHSSSLLWTYPNLAANARYPENFHFDVADFNSAILYFYISDVDMDSGPHVMVEGTHKHKSLHQMFNPFLTDEQALQQYGDRVKTVTGVAGTGFFEDQVAFHKRQACNRPRLAFLAAYHLHRGSKVKPK